MQQGERLETGSEWGEKSHRGESLRVSQLYDRDGRNRPSRGQKIWH